MWKGKKSSSIAWQSSSENLKCQFAMPTVFHQTDVDGVFRSLTNYLHFLCEPRAQRPHKRSSRVEQYIVVCYANNTNVYHGENNPVKPINQTIFSTLFQQTFKEVSSSSTVRVTDSNHFHNNYRENSPFMTRTPWTKCSMLRLCSIFVKFQ